MAKKPTKKTEGENEHFSEEPVGPMPADRRASALEDIAQSRRDVIAVEMVDEDMAMAGDPEPDPEPEVDGGDPYEGDAPAVDAAPEEPMYEVINRHGVKETVPLSRLVGSFQKEEAAESRLEKATKILDNVEKMENDRIAASGDGGFAEDNPDGEEPVGDGEVDYNDLAQKLQYGNQEEAAAALEDTVKKLATTGTSENPQDIAAQVIDTVHFNEALRDFGSDYSDILGDRHLSALAGQTGRSFLQSEIESAAREGRPRRPYSEIFKATGDYVREWKQSLTGAPSEDSGDADPNPGDDGSVVVDLGGQRAARRQASTPVPASHGSRAPAASNRQPRQKTETEKHRNAIEDMQKARGQNR